MSISESVLAVVQFLFFAYLIINASFLLLSVVVGGVHLHSKHQQGGQEEQEENEPSVSILVPAYNEEVTIVSSINSLLQLDYKNYEIIVLDDGSKDNTAQLVRDTFLLEESDRTIEYIIPCKPYHRVSQRVVDGIQVTLIEKENGGKGDVLNLGINAAQYDYFLCLDADSLLQSDSLKNIVRPVQKDASVISVGGQVQVSQGVEITNGVVSHYQLPWQLVLCSQAIEYDCSFLGSRILLDYLDSNLIISGAFGLFHKKYVQAVGGYDTKTLGEDMELVMKLHYYCCNNNIPYRICYETSAICWSQAPSTLTDLRKQRRRWFLGLYQCLRKYWRMLTGVRFGLVGALSYVYYLFFELLAPFVESIGLLIVIISVFFQHAQLTFFSSFFLLYVAYCSLVTVTSFLQRAYFQKIFITPVDLCKVAYATFFRYLFLHWILHFVRITSFIGYRKKKHEWGGIVRTKH